MTARPDSLRLGHARGATRYFLLDRALSGGDIVQLCASGGWITGRFEWDPGASAEPTFHFSIELEGGGVEAHQIVISDRALLRWPPSGAGDEG